MAALFENLCVTKMNVPKFLSGKISKGPKFWVGEGGIVQYFTLLGKECHHVGMFKLAK
jgi:hypothetical protein